ncbi:Nedd4 e3 ubiquitin-protein ligase wwp1, partial [Globisporangium polare]
HELLMVFDPEELDYVLCGSDEIDVDDWEKHTRVNASLHGHKALRWFWEFVREMPNEYRRRLLHFATGSSRVPLGGFAALTSLDGRICPFLLKGVPLEENEYISSRACFNRLDVPLYDSRVKMGTVLFAILETELHGFTTD